MPTKANLLLVKSLSSVEKLKKNHIFTMIRFFLRWQLAGGDVHSELKAVGLIRNEAPILTMPK